MVKTWCFSIFIHKHLYRDDIVIYKVHKLILHDWFDDMVSGGNGSVQTDESASFSAYSREL